MSRIRLDMTPRTTAPGFERYATIGGVRVLFRLLWLERISRWSIDMRTSGGDVLTMPHTVCPSGEIVWDVRRDDAPSGRLVWSRGPDPYVRDDLGTSISLIYVEADEETTPDVPDLLRRLT